MYSPEVLKSNLYDCNNVYILVSGDVIIRWHNVAQGAFKKCATFTKCVTKIDGTTVHDPEDLDLVMPINNQLEYSSNYSDMTGSLWIYSIDEGKKFDTEVASIDNLEYLKQKAKLLECASSCNLKF